MLCSGASQLAAVRLLFLPPLSIIPELNINRHSIECHVYLPEDVEAHMPYVIKINIMQNTQNETSLIALDNCRCECLRLLSFRRDLCSYVKTTWGKLQI